MRGFHPEHSQRAPRRTIVKTAILLYEGMTCLDAMGPYEVLASLPGNEVWFVAGRRGELPPPPGAGVGFGAGRRVETPPATPALGLVADRAIADVDAADILVVPGGDES